MAQPSARTDTAGPIQLEGLSHITLPCRDAKEAKRFWVSLFGAGIQVDYPWFVEVNVGGTILGFVEGNPLVERGETEAPHVAFLLRNDRLEPFKAWLAANGIPTQALWTRGTYAHMYFCDPSANLFEIICPDYPDVDALPRATVNGGDLVFNPTELTYDWQG